MSKIVHKKHRELLFQHLFSKGSVVLKWRKVVKTECFFEVIVKSTLRLRQHLVSHAAKAAKLSSV